MAHQAGQGPSRSAGGRAVAAQTQTASSAKPRRAPLRATSQCIIVTALVCMTTLANAAFMPFEGRLLVLNEPRKADKLVASPTFAFYYPDPASEPLGQSPLRAAVWVVTSVCGRPVQGGMSVQSRTAIRAGSIVKALELPCEGYSGTGAAWSARPNSACGWNELWGWLEYARDSTPELGQFGVGWPVCKAWQQRGSLGCDAGAGCAMWVKADRANLLECFNAPHAYKLGFASAPSVRERLLLHTLNATLDVSSGALGTQQPSPSPVLLRRPGGRPGSRLRLVGSGRLHLI
eukprot:XP_001702200.1 predicted protein [Chlamydomonas reinhardtii]